MAEEESLTAFVLAVILVIVVQAVPRVGVGVPEVIVDVHRIVEVLAPSQVTVGLDFIRKTLNIIVRVREFVFTEPLRSN